MNSFKLLNDIITITAGIGAIGATIWFAYMVLRHTRVACWLTTHKWVQVGTLNESFKNIPVAFCSRCHKVQ